MADRYWILGTGTWDSTSTTNWSASSGGAGGASVPTASDNVFFDANSNVGVTAFTVTMANSPRVCNDFTASGLDGVMTLAGASISLTVSGSLTNQATNFSRTYTGTTTFNATTTGKTVTTNGVAFVGRVTFNGVGGAWTLGSALSASGQIITVTNGTFDTSSVGNYSVTAFQFSSSNSNVRTINLNASTVTLSASGSAWEMPTSTNATLNAGTSTINCSDSTATFAGGGLTYYNVSFTSTALASPAITGANTFNNLSITGRTTVGIGVLSLSANQTINGTFTVSAGTASAYRMQISSDTLGTTRTLTCAAVSLTDVDFRDITIAGAASPASGTRLGDCKGNSGITFDAAKTVYYRQTSSADWGATGSGSWSATSGGAFDATQFPLAQDTAVFPAVTYPGGSTTQLINAAYNIGTIDMSLRTSSSMNLNISGNTPTIYGNWINGTVITIFGNGNTTFAGRTSQTITSVGRSFSQPITINSPSGSVTLQDAMSLSGLRSVTLTTGTLDLNNFTLTTGTFNSTNSNTRTIAFGTGNITCTSTGTVWTTATTTGLTTTGTQVVNVTSTGSTAITVSPGALSEANSISFNFTGGTYALTFLNTASDTVRNVNFTGYAGTLAATNTAIIYGNLTLSSGMTLTASGNALSFRATSGTKTITTNAKTLDFPISFNCAGAIYQLQDAFTIGVTRSTTLTLGTLDLNNFTYSSGTFIGSGAGTRTIAFGTGQITCTGTGTVWNSSTVTSLTITGTPVVNVTSVGSTAINVYVGQLSEANSISFNFTGGTYALLFGFLTGTPAVRNLNFTGYAGTFTIDVGANTVVYGNLTVSSGMTVASSTATMTFGATSGTKTITTNAKTLNFPLTFDGVGGTYQLQDALTMGSTRTATLTNGTLDLQSFKLSTGLFDSSNSNTRTIAFGTGSIDCTGTGTVWTTATATNLTTTGTQVVNVTSVGSTAITVSTGALSEANSISYNFTGGTYALTFLATASNSARNVDFTGFAGTLDTIATTNIFGNLKFSTGMTLTFANATLVFAKTSGTQLITTNAKTIDFNIQFNGVGGTLQLQDALTMGSTRGLSIVNGILDLFGKTLTVGTAFSTAGTGTRNLTFNGGTLVCPAATTTAFNNAAPTGFTTTAGTGTGTISMTAATAKTFVGGGSTFNCTLNQGGAGDLTITGSNTFSNITNTVQPASILFTAGTTSTFSSFSLSGTAGNLITIGSVTAASHTLSKASGTVSVSFCSISRSSATGGATWDALTANGNVDGGNNTGWSFGGVIYAAVIDETATATDVFLSLAAFLSVLAETATATDSPSVAASTFNAPVAETATATDAILGLAAFSSALAETATATDSDVGFISFPASIAETATATDSVLSFAAFYAALAEAATATDSPSVAASTFNAPVAETATATDSVLSLAAFSSALAETATATDAVLSQAAFSSALSETATATDSPSVAASTFNAPVAETATATDSVISFAAFSAALAETATATDSDVGFILFPASIAETATATDAVLSFAAFSAALAETATATDSPLVAPSTFNAPVAETATATDSPLVAPSTFNVPVSETVTISDLVLGAYLWNLIDDSQSVTWQNVNSSPGTTWSPINTDPNTGWTDISTVN